MVTLLVLIIPGAVGTQMEAYAQHMPEALPGAQISVHNLAFWSSTAHPGGLW